MVWPTMTGDGAHRRALTARKRSVVQHSSIRLSFMDRGERRAFAQHQYQTCTPHVIAPPLTAVVVEDGLCCTTADETI